MPDNSQHVRLWRWTERWWLWVKMGWSAGWLVMGEIVWLVIGEICFNSDRKRKSSWGYWRRAGMNGDPTTTNPEGVAQRTWDHFLIWTVEVIWTCVSGVDVSSCRNNAHGALSKCFSCCIFSALASKMSESARFPGFAGSAGDPGTPWVITFFCSFLKAWINGGVFVCLKQINRNSRNIKKQVYPRAQGMY